MTGNFKGMRNRLRPVAILLVVMMFLGSFPTSIAVAQVDEGAVVLNPLDAAGGEVVLGTDGSAGDETPPAPEEAQPQDGTGQPETESPESTGDAGGPEAGDAAQAEEQTTQSIVFTVALDAAMLTMDQAGDIKVALTDAAGNPIEELQLYGSGTVTFNLGLDRADETYGVYITPPSDALVDFSGLRGEPGERFGQVYPRAELADAEIAVSVLEPEQDEEAVAVNLNVRLSATDAQALGELALTMRAADTEIESTQVETGVYGYLVENVHLYESYVLTLAGINAGYRVSEWDDMGEGVFQKTFGPDELLALDGATVFADIVPDDEEDPAYDEILVQVSAQQELTVGVAFEVYASGEQTATGTGAHQGDGVFEMSVPQKGETVRLSLTGLEEGFSVEADEQAWDYADGKYYCEYDRAELLGREEMLEIVIGEGPGEEEEEIFSGMLSVGINNLEETGVVAAFFSLFSSGDAPEEGLTVQLYDNNQVVATALHAGDGVYRMSVDGLNTAKNYELRVSGVADGYKLYGNWTENGGGSFTLEISGADVQEYVEGGRTMYFDMYAVDSANADRTINFDLTVFDGKSFRQNHPVSLYYAKLDENGNPVRMDAPTGVNHTVQQYTSADSGAVSWGGLIRNDEYVYLLEIEGPAGSYLSGASIDVDPGLTFLGGEKISGDGEEIQYKYTFLFKPQDLNSLTMTGVGTIVFVPTRGNFRIHKYFTDVEWDPNNPIYFGLIGDKDLSVDNYSNFVWAELTRVGGSDSNGGYYILEFKDLPFLDENGTTIGNNGVVEDPKAISYWLFEYCHEDMRALEEDFDEIIRLSYIKDHVDGYAGAPGYREDYRLYQSKKTVSLYETGVVSSFTYRFWNTRYPYRFEDNISDGLFAQIEASTLTGYPYSWSAEKYVAGVARDADAGKEPVSPFDSITLDNKGDDYYAKYRVELTRQDPDDSTEPTTTLYLNDISVQLEYPKRYAAGGYYAIVKYAIVDRNNVKFTGNNELESFINAEHEVEARGDLSNPSGTSGDTYRLVVKAPTLRIEDFDKKFIPNTGQEYGIVVQIDYYDSGGNSIGKHSQKYARAIHDGTQFNGDTISEFYDEKLVGFEDILNVAEEAVVGTVRNLRINGEVKTNYTFNNSILSYGGEMTVDGNDQIILEYEVTFTDDTWNSPNAVSYVNKNRVSTTTDTSGMQFGSEAELEVNPPSYAYVEVEKTLTELGVTGPEPGVRFQIYEGVDGSGNAAGNPIAEGVTNGDGYVILTANGGVEELLTKEDFDSLPRLQEGETYYLFVIVDDADYPPFITDGTATGPVSIASGKWTQSGSKSFYQAFTVTGDGKIRILVEDKPDTGLTIEKKGAEAATSRFYLYRADDLNTPIRDEAMEAAGVNYFTQKKEFYGLDTGSYVLYEVTGSTNMPQGSQWSPVADQNIPGAILQDWDTSSGAEKKAVFARDVTVNNATGSTPDEIVVENYTTPDVQITKKVTNGLHPDFNTFTFHVFDSKGDEVFFTDLGNRQYRYGGSDRLTLRFDAETQLSLRITGMPEGSYKVEEGLLTLSGGANAGLAVYEQKNRTQDLVLAYGEDGGVTPLEFENELLDGGSLTIEKKLVGAHYDESFNFYIYRLNANTNKVEAVDLKAQGVSMTLVQPDGTSASYTVPNVNSFALRPGQKMIISDIPQGVVYYVEEAANQNFTTTATLNNSGVTFEGDTLRTPGIEFVQTGGGTTEYELVYTNERKTGSLELAKVLNGNAYDDNFGITVKGPFVQADGTAKEETHYFLFTKDQTGVSGEFTVATYNDSLSSPNYIPVPGVIYGGTYVIEEYDEQGYLSNYSTAIYLNGGSTPSGERTVSVKLDGTVSDYSVAVENTRGAKNLTLEKSANGWPTEGFRFALYSRASDAEEWALVSDGVKTVGIGENMSTTAQWSALPQGLQYRLYELAPQNGASFTPGAGWQSYSAATDHPADTGGVDLAGSYFQTVTGSLGSTVKVSNQLTHLRVEKKLKSGSQQDFQFVITASGTPLTFDKVTQGGVTYYVYNDTLDAADDANTLIDIRAGGTVNLYGIPAESYSIRELVPPGYSVQYQVGNADPVDPNSSGSATITVAAPGSNSSAVVLHNTVEEFSIELTKTLVLYDENGQTVADPVGGGLLWPDGFAFELYVSSDGGAKYEPVSGSQRTLSYSEGGSTLTWTGLHEDLLYRIYEKEKKGYAAVGTGWTPSTTELDKDRGAYFYDVDNGNPAVAAVNAATVIEVEKQLSQNANQAATFTFRITGPDGEVSLTPVGDGSHLKPSAGGSSLVSIGAGDVLTIVGLPVGKYTIEEVGADAYTVVIDQDAFDVDDIRKHITIVNTVETGSITLKKTVEATDGVTVWPDEPAGFEFRLYENLDDGNGWQLVAVAENPFTATQQLSDKTWSDLPADRAYRIYEVTDLGYAPSGWSVTDDADRGAYYTEVSLMSGSAVVSASEEAKNRATMLSVTKQVELEEGTPDPAEEFTFVIRSGAAYVLTTAAGGDRIYASTTDNEAAAAIVIHHGETVHIAGLPYGSYTVEEVGDTGGYNVKITDDGAVTLSSTALSKKVTITNALKNVGVQVSKVVDEVTITTATQTKTEAIWPVSGEFTFALYRLENNVWTMVDSRPVGAGTPAVWGNQPYGYEYRVYEINPAGYVPQGWTAESVEYMGETVPAYYIDVDVKETGGVESYEVHNTVTKFTVEKVLLDDSKAGLDFTFEIRDGEGNAVPFGSVLTTDGFNTGKYFLYGSGYPTSANSFTIKAGEVLEFYGLPVEGTYTIVETNSQGLDDSYNVDGATTSDFSLLDTNGALQSPAIKITNGTAFFDVELNKSVSDGNWSDFTFTLQFQNADGTWVGVSAADVDEAARDSFQNPVTISSAQPVTWSGLPFERHYRVVETGVDGYVPHSGTTAWQADGQNYVLEFDPDFAAIRADGSYKVDVENRGTQLTITKEASDENGPITGAFTFQVRTGDENGAAVNVSPDGSGNYRVDAAGGPDITITLDAQSGGTGSVQVYGLPTGTQYTVVETEADGNTDVDSYYTVGYDGNRTFTLSADSLQNTTTVTNSKTGFGITLEKQVAADGEDGEVWPEDGFQFELYDENGNLQGARVTYKKGESPKVWDSLLFGQTYTLYEIIDTDGYVPALPDGWQRGITPNGDPAYELAIQNGAGGYTLPGMHTVTARNDVTKLTVDKVLFQNQMGSGPFQFQIRTNPADPDTAVSLRRVADAADNTLYYTYEPRYASAGSFEIAPDTEVKIYGLPVGTTYYVVESVAGGYSPTYTGGDDDTGAFTFTADGSLAAAVTIQNGAAFYDLRVNKDAPAGLWDSFTFQLYRRPLNGEDTDPWEPVPVSADDTRTAVTIDEQNPGETWKDLEFVYEYRLYEITDTYKPADDGTAWTYDATGENGAPVGYYRRVVGDYDSLGTTGTVTLNIQNDITRLTVHKALVNESAPDKVFYVEIRIPSGDPDTAGAAVTFVPAADGYRPGTGDNETQQLPVSVNTPLQVYGLVAGTAYEVVETGVTATNGTDIDDVNAFYTVTYDGNESFTIEAGGAVEHSTTIQNDKTDFGIQVTKTVLGGMEWPEDGFQFVLYEEGALVSDTAHPDGIVTLKKEDNSYTWTPLNYGKDYQLYELVLADRTDGYAPTQDMTLTTTPDGAPAYLREIPFTVAPGEAGHNPQGYYSNEARHVPKNVLVSNKISQLTVEKTLAADGSTGGRFMVSITRPGDNGAEIVPLRALYRQSGEVYYVYDPAGSDNPFEIKHGQKINIYGLPLGVNYTVTETETGGNTPDYPDGQNVLFTKDDLEKEIGIVNGQANFNLRVVKKGVSDNYWNDGFTFELVKMTNNGPEVVPANQTLTDSSTPATWSGLTYSTTYRLYELTPGYLPESDNGDWTYDSARGFYYLEFQGDFSVEGSDGVREYQVENTVTELTVDKVVDSLTGSQSDTFNFVVRSGDTVYTFADGRYTGTVSVDDSTDLTPYAVPVTTSASTVLYGLPLNVTYTLQEIGVEDVYTPAYEPGSFRFSALGGLTQQVTITNAEKEFGITVRKSVHDDLWTTDGFTFELYIENDDGSLSKVDDHQHQVTKSAASARWSPLVYGRTYVLFEIDPSGGYVPATPDGWTTGWTGGTTDDGDSGYMLRIVPGADTYTANEELVLDVVNDYTKLAVNKEMGLDAEGNPIAAAPGTQFTFQLLRDGTPVSMKPVFSTEDGSLLHYYYDAKGSSLRDSFQIAAGESAEFYGLPLDGTYSVEETDSQGYAPQYSADVVFDDTLTAGLTITNLKADWNLELTKALSADSNQLWLSGGFPFELRRSDDNFATYDVVENRVNLTDTAPGNSVSWTELAYGYKYRIYEFTDQYRPAAAVSVTAGQYGDGSNTEAGAWVYDAAEKAFYLEYQSSFGSEGIGGTRSYTVTNDITRLTVDKQLISGDGTTDGTFRFLVLSADRQTVYTFDADNRNTGTVDVGGGDLNADFGISAITIAAGDDILLYGLPFGSYVLHEIGDGVSSFDYDVNYEYTGDTIVIASDDVVDSASIVNSKNMATITLTKEAEDDIWPADGFTFALYELDADDEWVPAADQATETVTTDDRVATWYAEFGKLYRIYELNTGGYYPAGWSVDDIGYYTDVNDATTQYEKTYEIRVRDNLTELSVSKTVVRPDKDTDGTFSFAVRAVGSAADLSFREVNGYYLHVSDPDPDDADIVTSMDIAHGETVTVKGLPIGVTYVVVETVTGGFADTYVYDDDEDADGFTFGPGDNKKRAAITNTVDATATRLTINKVIEEDRGYQNIPGTVFQVAVYDRDNGNYLVFDGGEWTGETTGNGLEALLSIPVAADGQRYAGTIVVRGLPVGDYTILEPEDLVPERFKQDFTETKPAENAPVFRIGTDENGSLEYQGTATVYNRVHNPSGYLNVLMTVDGPTDYDDEFYVRVVGDFDYSDVDGPTDIRTGNVWYTFTPDGHGGHNSVGYAYEVPDVIAGYSYEVWQYVPKSVSGEDDRDLNESDAYLEKYTVGYKLKDAVAAETPEEAPTLHVEDTRDTKDLVLSKEVVGTEAGTDKFEFLLSTINDEYLVLNSVTASNGYYETYQFLGTVRNPDEEALERLTVKLPAGQKALITGLPIGTVVEVNETDTFGHRFIASYVVDGMETNRFTVGVGLNAEKTQHDMTVTNEAITALTIVKKVREGGGAKVEEYPYAFSVIRNSNTNDILYFTQDAKGDYVYAPDGALDPQAQRYIYAQTYATPEDGYVARGEVVVKGLPFSEVNIYNVVEVGVPDIHYVLESISTNGFKFQENTISQIVVTAINRWKDDGGTGSSSSGGDGSGSGSSNGGGDGSSSGSGGGDGSSSGGGGGDGSSGGGGGGSSSGSGGGSGSSGGGSGSSGSGSSGVTLPGGNDNSNWRDRSGYVWYVGRDRDPESVDTSGSYGMDPETTFTIEDEDTPLSTIFDSPVPLAGGIAVGTIIGVFGVCLVGLGVILKRKQRDRK